MKTLKYLLLTCFAIGQSAMISAKDFELQNKSSQPISFALGTKKNPPTMNPTRLSPALLKTIPGTTRRETINNIEVYQLLLVDPAAPDVGFLYEFRDKTGRPVDTNIYLRVVDKKGTVSVEPQTSIFSSNLKKEDIILIGTVGAPEKKKK